MLVFTGLNTSPLLVRPMPKYKFEDMKSLEEGQTRDMRCTCVHNVHTSRTHVLPLNINVGDYVIIHSDIRKEQKVQTRRRRPMRVREAKSALVLIVKDLVNSQQLKEHARCIIPCLITKQSDWVSK